MHTGKSADIIRAHINNNHTLDDEKLRIRDWRKLLPKCKGLDLKLIKEYDADGVEEVSEWALASDANKMKKKGPTRAAKAAAAMKKAGFEVPGYETPRDVSKVVAKTEAQMLEELTKENIYEEEDVDYELGFGI